MTIASASVLPDSTDQTIGLNVHDLLYRRKNSQKDLALVLGVTPSVLSKKLRGESSWSARQIALTAGFLDVEPGRLFRQSTVARVPAKLRSISGEGRDPQPRSPLLATV